MDDGAAEPAEILDGTIQTQIDVRRASNIEVHPRLVHFVERSLDAQREAIADFFGVVFTDREGPGFLRYGDGGFYRPHRDRGVAAGWPGAARRRVAVIVFLNSSRAVDPDGDFGGGELELNVDGPAVRIQPTQGLLVAFPADVLHQVTTVQGGPRDIVVDWFY